MAMWLACLACVAAAWASESTSPNFVVHEWGTYTSMQGSDGVGTMGLHHGEERLPDFVRSRGNGFSGSSTGRKLQGINPPPPHAPPTGCVWCTQVDFDPTQAGPLGITQKLETPVLYFYSPKEMDVKVDVSFPNGLVTEVYPNVADFTPAYKEVSAVSNGTAQWRVKVEAPKDVPTIPEVVPTSIWAPSRRVSANYVTNEKTQESEHHIFYRGVGQFPSELKVTSTVDTLSIFNTRREGVPAVFVLESNGKQGWIRAVGPLSGHTQLSVPLAGSHLGDELLDMDLFVTRATVLLEKSLMEAGLFPLEARAMVDTWVHSYFKTPGVRVLYVSPRNWVDKLLPITVTPQPQEMERVLVGRVELLLKAEEDRMVHAIKNEMTKTMEYTAFKKVLDTSVGVPSLLRFGEAKLRRSMELSGMTSSVKSHLEKYITEELTF